MDDRLVAPLVDAAQPSPVLNAEPLVTVVAAQALAIVMHAGVVEVVCGHLYLEWGLRNDENAGGGGG